MGKLPMSEFSGTKDAGVAWPEVTKFAAPIIGCRKAGFWPVVASEELEPTRAMYCWMPGVVAGRAVKAAACSGVPWIESDPAGTPKNLLTSMAVRPKLLAPMSEKPVSLRRVISVEKK